MNRSDFIKTTLLGIVGLAVVPSMVTEPPTFSWKNYGDLKLDRLNNMLECPYPEFPNIWEGVQANFPDAKFKLFVGCYDAIPSVYIYYTNKYGAQRRLKTHWGFNDNQDFDCYKTHCDYDWYIRSHIETMSKYIGFEIIDHNYGTDEEMAAAWTRVYNPEFTIT
jgi:hypothetical protein